MRSDKSDAQRAIFVAEYVTDRNGARAAKEAGFGKTAKSHRERASKLLAEPGIQAAIAEKSRLRVERLELKADTYLTQLDALCTFDPLDFYDARGNALPLHRVPAKARMAIKSMQTIIKNAKAGDGAVDEVLVYHFADRRGALELMMKHLGLLIDKKEVGKPGAFAKLAPDEKRKKMIELAKNLGYTVRHEPSSKPH